MVAVPLGPAQLDITGVRAGDLNEFQLTILSDGVPVNLTDQEITATARLKKDTPEGLDAVITVTDPVNGVLRIRWPGEAVRTWLGTELKTKGVWDLQIANGTDPTTVVAGSFAAELDVTR
jgi:hypothetical protein